MQHSYIRTNCMHFAFLVIELHLCIPLTCFVHGFIFEFFVAVLGSALNSIASCSPFAL